MHQRLPSCHRFMAVGNFVRERREQELHTRISLYSPADEWNRSSKCYRDTLTVVGGVLRVQLLLND